MSIDMQLQLWGIKNDKTYIVPVFSMDNTANCKEK